MTSALLYRFSTTVEKGALLISKALAFAGLGVLLLFAIATLCDGMLRHLINQPIELVRDSGGLVVAVTVVACFPLAMLSRSNITIKFIDLILPDVASRILNALASMLVLLTFVFIAIEFFWLAQDSAQSNDTTVMLGVPKAPFWYGADAMFWAAVAAQALIAITDVARCFTGEGPELPAEIMAADEVA